MYFWTEKGGREEGDIDSAPASASFQVSDIRIIIHSISWQHHWWQQWGALQVVGAVHYSPSVVLAVSTNCVSSGDCGHHAGQRQSFVERTWVRGRESGKRKERA